MKTVVFLLCTFFLLFNGGIFSYGNTSSTKKISESKEQISNKSLVKLAGDNDENIFLFDDFDIDNEEDFHFNNTFKAQTFGTGLNFFGCWYTAEYSLFSLIYIKNIYTNSHLFFENSSRIYIAISNLRI